jgi:hypothetical protein
VATSDSTTSRLALLSASAGRRQLKWPLPSSSWSRCSSVSLTLDSSGKNAKPPLHQPELLLETRRRHVWFRPTIPHQHATAGTEFLTITTHFLPFGPFSARPLTKSNKSSFTNRPLPMAHRRTHAKPQISPELPRTASPMSATCSPQRRLPGSIPPTRQPWRPCTDAPLPVFPTNGARQAAAVHCLWSHRLGCLFA